MTMTTTTTIMTMNTVLVMGTGTIIRMPTSTTRDRVTNMIMITSTRTGPLSATGLCSR
jgi:hypothetical protein